MTVIEPAAKREDRLTGLHANTQIPKFIGAARQYELTGEEWLKTASTFFWETVVNERSYVIGGHSDGEMFSPKERLSEALGPNTTETCNTYNMLKLTRHLFCWDPQPSYADYYERALYNHILCLAAPGDGHDVLLPAAAVRARTRTTTARWTASGAAPARAWRTMPSTARASTSTTAVSPLREPVHRLGARLESQGAEAPAGNEVSRTNRGRSSFSPATEPHDVGSLHPASLVGDREIRDPRQRREAGRPRASRAAMRC